MVEVDGHEPRPWHQKGKGFEDFSDETVWANGAGAYGGEKPLGEPVAVEGMTEGVAVVNPVQALKLLLGDLDTNLSLNANSCRDNGKGWVSPLPTGVGGRATGAGACITNDMPKGSRATKNIPGYAWAAEFVEEVFDVESSDAINSCHLIAKSLGGSGKDKSNLATCSRPANFYSTLGAQNGGMAPFEQQVRSEVDDDTDVFYKVIPQYFGDRVVPYEFKVSAWSIAPDGTRTTMFENEVVENEINGVNLGIQFDNGQPVPLS